MNDWAGMLASLSAREHDVLRMVAEGAQISDVAADLGVSRSTVEKQLLSARRRLGVTHTGAAVALFWQSRCNRALEVAQVRVQLRQGRLHEQTIAQFVNELDCCRSFDEAWQALVRCLNSLGFNHVNFGLVAEPFGQLTNGARMLGTTMPGDVAYRYARAGGVEIDPIPALVATKSNALVIKQAAMAAHFRENLPQPACKLALSCIQRLGMTHFFLLPGRDAQTGAPFSITLSVSRERAVALQADRGRLASRIRNVLKLFWQCCRAKGWLARLAGLAPRQTAALRLAARGMSGAEAAERLGLSRRATEKLLFRARTVLGARNTPAAVYRAAVYGAL